MLHPVRRKRCPVCGELYIGSRRPYYSKHIFFFHSLHPTRYCKAVADDVEPGIIETVLRRPQWNQ